MSFEERAWLTKQAKPMQWACALYDYLRQTDEELTFKEGDKLEVFDTSDEDWTLCGVNGDYGFAPANYLELEGTSATQYQEEQAPPTPARPTVQFAEPEPEPETPSPAAALAGVMSRQVPPPPIDTSHRPQYSPEQESQPPTPSLPARPQSYQPAVQSPRSPHYPGSPDSAGPRVSPPDNRVIPDDYLVKNYQPQSGGFHLYNVSEMVSVMGKRKKIPVTLGINLAKGMITFAPEKTRDGPQQEWTADKMTHYSLEGKHVFLELVRPSKSLDLHAGAKDTAHEIVSSLGEMAGAVRAEGFKEILAAASGSEKKKGRVLFDFMAQGDDEVTVAIDDEVIILDDQKSEEWWQVRRLKNNKEGMVPSTYIEIVGTIAAPDVQRGLNAGRSTVEQNRLEEQRLAKEAMKAGRDPNAEVGHLAPPRGSSLSVRGNDSEQRRRDSRLSSSAQKERTSESRPSSIVYPSRYRSVRFRDSVSSTLTSVAEPNPDMVRTWTDRSKSFQVEAEFLRLTDGKIHLHKNNGVKIAVPVSKMSLEDIEFVERHTGISLDEDKPLSEIKKRNSMISQKAGATIEKPQKPEYDWFNFFLACDVGVGLCERYSQVFNRDNIDESVLPDVDSTVLRNLGLREGDIIKVMRHLDAKYNRKKKGEEEAGEGGLFSGPGGGLKNNTRKGRPAPAVATSDTVDPKAFSQQHSGDSNSKAAVEVVKQQAPAPISKTAGGFDDDAWDVKPLKEQPKPAAATEPVAAPTPAPAPKPQPPNLAGSMQELSLLSQPLQPAKYEPPNSNPPLNISPAPAQPQPTGATPSLFQNLPPPGQQNQFQTQQNIARARPAAPQYNTGAGGLMPPPPPRPLSAPNAAHQSAFAPPPLQPQMTGIPTQHTGFGSIAPPGQSLQEISQQRMMQQQQAQWQQQQQMMQPMMTGFQPQQTGFGQPMMPQSTGFGPGQTFSPPPFSDARAFSPAPLGPQPTGFMPGQQFPQATGIQNLNGTGYLPSALQPQQTGFNSTPNGYGVPVPPMPQQQAAPKLVPQKTGPPPPVRFGVKPDAKKLVSQPTGKRANLAAASKLYVVKYK